MLTPDQPIESLATPDNPSMEHAVYTDQQSLTFREKFHALREVVAEDYHAGGILQKIGIIATAGWLAYEWGPGNETVTPIIAGQVINNVDGVRGIAITAGVTAGFTFFQQIASGSTLAATATQFPRAAEKAFGFVKDEEHPELNAKPWRELSLKKRLLYAFTMGTTFVATREAAVTGDVSFKNSMKRVVGSAALCAASVGTLGATVESIDHYTSAAPEPIQTAGDVIVFTLTNPATWLGLLAYSTYSEHRRRKALRAVLSIK